MKSIKHRLAHSYSLAGTLILVGILASGCSKSSETNTSIRRAPEEEKQPSQISSTEATNQDSSTHSSNDTQTRTSTVSTPVISSPPPSWIRSTPSPSPSDQPPIASNVTPLPSTGLVFMRPGDLRPLDAPINEEGELSEEAERLLSSSRDLVHETLEKFSQIPQSVTSENIEQMRRNYCRLLSSSLDLREYLHQFIEVVKQENVSLSDGDFDIYQNLNNAYAQICQNIWEEFLPKIQAIDSQFSDTSCLPR